MEKGGYTTLTLSLNNHLENKKFQSQTYASQTPGDFCEVWRREAASSIFTSTTKNYQEDRRKLVHVRKQLKKMTGE